MVRVMDCAGFDDGGKRPWAKESRQTLKAGKGNKMSSPLKPSKRMQPSGHLDFRPVTPVWDFYPPGPQDYKFVLFLSH